MVYPIALKRAKTLLSFGHSECNRVKVKEEMVSISQVAVGAVALEAHCILCSVYERPCLSFPCLSIPRFEKQPSEEMANPPIEGSMGLSKLGK